MRHGTSNRRHRNRNSGSGGNNGNGRRNNNQRARVFDSNGPDVRIRGTAHQVAEKYLSLAKDATSAGDIIVAENYFQHAEHYIRIINEIGGNTDNSKLSNGKNKDKNVSDNAGNVVEAKSEDGVEDLSLPASIVGTAETVKKEVKAVEEAVE